MKFEEINTEKKPTKIEFTNGREERKREDNQQNL